MWCEFPSYRSRSKIWSTGKSYIFCSCENGFILWECIRPPGYPQSFLTEWSYSAEDDLLVIKGDIQQFDWFIIIKSSSKNDSLFPRFDVAILWEFPPSSSFVIPYLYVYVSLIVRTEESERSFRRKIKISYPPVSNIPITFLLSNPMLYSNKRPSSVLCRIKNNKPRPSSVLSFYTLAQKQPPIPADDLAESQPPSAGKCQPRKPIWPTAK